MEEEKAKKEKESKSISNTDQYLKDIGEMKTQKKQGQSATNT